MTLSVRIAIAFCVLLARDVSRADIYEWRDADGNRHFTNNMVNVPDAQQSAAKVIVTGIQSPPAQEIGPTSEAAPPQTTEPRHEPVIVYDNSRADPYSQGIRDGI